MMSMYHNTIGIHRDLPSINGSCKFKGKATAHNFNLTLEKELQNSKRELITKDQTIQRLEFQLELVNKHHDQEKNLLQKRLGVLTDQHMVQEKMLATLRNENQNLQKQITFVQATSSALQRRVSELMRQIALEKTRYQGELTGLKRKMTSKSLLSKDTKLCPNKLTSPRVVVNHQAKIYRDCLKEQQKQFDEEIVKSKDRPGVYGLPSLKTPASRRTPNLWRKGSPTPTIGRN